MRMFGRELTIDQIIGLVETNANPYEDVVHCAALELIAALRDAQRRADAAVEILSGHCFSCAFVNDCAKHDNNDAAPSTWYHGDCEDWEYCGPRAEKGEAE